MHFRKIIVLFAFMLLSSAPARALSNCDATFLNRLLETVMQYYPTLPKGSWARDFNDPVVIEKILWELRHSLKDIADEQWEMRDYVTGVAIGGGKGFLEIGVLLLNQDLANKAFGLPTYATDILVGLTIVASGVASSYSVYKALGMSRQNAEVLTKQADTLEFLDRGIDAVSSDAEWPYAVEQSFDVTALLRKQRKLLDFATYYIELSKPNGKFRLRITKKL